MSDLLDGLVGFRPVIDRFIQERKQAKLDKLKDDDPKRQDVLAQHESATWVQDAARRVAQIQAVTHSLKPIHPDARGTNLYVEPASLPALAELGSHALGPEFSADVVGNAAALDVYKFLRLKCDGRSLLAALQAEDADALRALHDDPAEARILRDAFVSLTEARTGEASTHTLAKQLYWLVGDDPCVDGQFELLAPLYATSLAHAVHVPIQEHRFGEANKAARLARREGKAYEGVLHDYPSLAVQKMGGTKPQNISQLNSERGGVNYLLASLPPQAWQARAPSLEKNAVSVFKRLFGARPLVRQTVHDLRIFLETELDPTMDTHLRREAMLDTLIDELVSMAGELQYGQPAGWTRDTERYGELAREEMLWLDPLRAEFPDEEAFAKEWLWMDWPALVGQRFGAWLNAQLENKLPVGDVELREWKKELLTDGGFAEQLRYTRQKLDVPNTVLVRHHAHDELGCRPGEQE